MSCKCYYPGCGRTFPSDTALSEHIFRDHGNGVNWNSRLIAAFAAIILAASLLVSPVKAQDVQPTPAPTASISTPPDMLHVVYLPLIESNDVVFGQPGGLPAH